MPMRSLLESGGRKMRRSKTLGEFIGVRCQPELIEAIDDWRRKQLDLPSRPEAIRSLVTAMLQVLGKDPGEKPTRKARSAQNI